MPAAAPGKILRGQASLRVARRIPRNTGNELANRLAGAQYACAVVDLSQNGDPMKLRALALLLGVVVSSTSAIAQVGIYGKFDATRLSTGTTNDFETPGWYDGGGAGVYYDFIHLGPIGFGADLRGNLLTGNQQKFRSALFGLRLAIKPPILPIRPYVQGSAGIGGGTHGGLANAGSIYSNKFEYQVLGGLDYAFFPHLDWRVAEFGYGRVTGISSGASASPVNLFTVSSGIVLRLP